LRPHAAISVLFLVPCAVFAQSSAAPAFDVASVKAAAPARGGGRGFGMGGMGGGPNQIQVEPGALTMRNVPLTAAIAWAYGVEPVQISGPNWLPMERFNIVAKAANAAPEDQLRLMLRTLLADRLKVAAHTEQKVMSYFVLTVAKGGPKFKESTDEGDPVLSAGPNNSTAIIRRVPVSQFVTMLQGILREPIVDQTGLKGRYDATLNVGALISTPIQNDDMTGTIANALQDLLGLKLEPKKGPIDMLVVDHAEKVPTEN
jgi:uncharacterized protein (TIGR03435 family)